MNWWKRLNSREQLRRANFARSSVCNVRGTTEEEVRDDDDERVDDVDDGAVALDGSGRVFARVADTRGALGGLQSVAGTGCFFGAFGLGGGRTRAGFGGSRPERHKKSCLSQTEFPVSLRFCISRVSYLVTRRTVLSLRDRNRTPNLGAAEETIYKEERHSIDTKFTITTKQRKRPIGHRQRENRTEHACDLLSVLHRNKWTYVAEYHRTHAFQQITVCFCTHVQIVFQSQSMDQLQTTSIFIQNRASRRRLHSEKITRETYVRSTGLSYIDVEATRFVNDVSSVDRLQSSVEREEKRADRL